MATIGTFTKTGDRYEGTVRTLTLNVPVSIVPIERESDNDNAPDHRAYSGPADFGAAWSRTSKAENFYLSVRLDDPSMTAPIFANLVLAEGDKWHLVWSRQK